MAEREEEIKHDAESQSDFAKWKEWIDSQLHKSVRKNCSHVATDLLN